MFGSLKEKLKSWVKKVTPGEQPEERPAKTAKKVKIKAPKKPEEKKLEKQIEKSKKQAEKLKQREEKEERKREEKEKKYEEESKKQAEKQEKSEEITPEQPTSEELTQEQTPEQPIQAEPPEPEIKKEKKGFFSKFRKKLGNEKFEELFSELELILLQNNVAVEVVEKIKLSLGEKLIGETTANIDLEQSLKESIEEILTNPPNILEQIKESLKVKQPFVVVFVGINGSGKTTTMAKFAHLLQKNNLSVCFAAADTFRAASIEQLQKHADKLKVHLIKKDYGSDPASVGFDAIQYAKKNHIEIVLIDTAGRMQNKDSLMREIEKITRVNKPDMRIFVGEAITGNDATEQAKVFDDAVALTGLILSKADVDEKGGTAISVSYVTKKPILYLGTGQSYNDLEVFDKDKLIKQLGL
jgi:fused signal recognition particle receptor